MAMVESPPNVFDQWKRGVDFFKKMLNSEELRRVVRKANDKYLSWEKFKYHKMPEGFSAEEAFAYLKFVRGSNTKNAPFTDKRGQPFTYWVTDSMMKALNEIDRWSGQIISTDHPEAIPARERYIISSLMEEAIASSQLEGAATTRKVAKEMLRSGRNPRNKSEQMILNNWRVMEHFHNERPDKITVQNLCEIHAMITDNTMPDASESGKLRRRDDIEVRYNNEVVHIPPKASELPKHIEALCQFASEDDSENWIHPVIKGALLHFWLAYDHPFTDGNGRTARALFYWYLLSRGYTLFEYVALSKYIVRAPGQYVRAYLYAETDGNDLDYFLQYNLQAIRLAFQELQEYLKRKQKEITDSNLLLRNYRGLNLRQKSVVNHAIRHPDAVYTIQTHRNIHGIAYDTARNDLVELAGKGLLEKEKHGREFVFVVSANLNKKLRLSNGKNILGERS